MLRQVHACEYAQTHQSIGCWHTHILDVDKDLGGHSELQLLCYRQHRHILEAFPEISCAVPISYEHDHEVIVLTTHVSDEQSHF